MKFRIFIFLFTLGLQIPAQEMNIITFNIRFNNPADGINVWPNRVEMVTGLLKFHKADIFGLQEALYGQIKDIETTMPGFGWFGSGRDDGDKAGEFSPIFYNMDLFSLVENGQFWLSETSDKPGLGWDAACNRVCVWGKFIQKKTGKKFYILNTHFDHIGDTARANSAILILKFIAGKISGELLPVILTGDFNLTPDQLPITLIKKELTDCRDISEVPPSGPIGTFNAFKFGSPLDSRIDYVFVNSKVKVLKYAVLSDSKDNRYPSDHCPVLVKVVLK
jgi:endonuclease/exonuclease/phosphatase family metal-dependent hydrolase